MCPRAACLWVVREQAWILTVECVDTAGYALQTSVCDQLASRSGKWNVEGRKPDVMPGHGEHAGGMAAGQLQASVVNVCRTLEGKWSCWADLLF